jgi:hypothetical protein
MERILMIEDIKHVDYIPANPICWQVTYKDGLVVGMSEKEFFPIARELEQRNAQKLEKFMRNEG